MSIFQSPCTPFSNSSTGRSLVRHYGTRQGLDSYYPAKWAIRTIIGLNTAVFGTWLYASSSKDKTLYRWMTENFMASPENWAAGRYWTLLTSAFSHVNLVHFFFNMYVLNVYGSILSFVPGVGALHVVVLALGSAVMGTYAWLDHNKSTPKVVGGRISPNVVRGGRGTQTGRSTAALGASGVVMGVGAAATCLSPFIPMSFMFIPVPIPLYVLTGLYVAADAYFLDSGSRIGHAAHLGGSVFGALYYFALLRRFGGLWQLMRLGRFAK